MKAVSQQQQQHQIQDQGPAQNLFAPIFERLNTMYKLISRHIPNTRYFFSYSAARAEAKALGLGPRSYKIKLACEPD